MDSSHPRSILTLPVQSTEHLTAVRDLFLEYVASLPFDLAFQDFDQELQSLPGDYAAPNGQLLLATVDDQPAGCIAMRPLVPSIGELKRLFVRPQFRGLGLGKKLTQAILEKAGATYERIRLDTTPTMTGAIRLYKSLGFRRIEAYRHNPIEGALFMELDLKRK